MNTLIHSLDTNNMKNTQVYKNAYRLSQKLRHQIDQLKKKVKDDDMQSSPTETMIAYDDEWKVKSLPKLSIDSSVTITMHNDEKSSSLYFATAFDSAVDLVMNKPLPSIYHNKIKHTTIIHVKKRYCGIRSFLTRSFQIHDIVVSRTVLDYSSAYFVKLFASKDKLTGVDKAVLKITLTSSNTNNRLFIIPNTPFTFYHINTLTKLQKSQDLTQFALVTDIQVQSALFTWLNYYHLQLPSMDLVTHVLREGLKIYIVYTQ
ncbi:hypothetical protein HPULCUR_001390 [Helicostylum pulchrum]|uniref:Uncharacterized protein n=1 Tax=Helicostylum pulchrum TaxID=562976 RepID=A0ABP9XNK2_9FUNG